VTPTRPFSPIVRGWLAFAALGTGIIHLALVIGAPLPLAVVFGVLGFTEFAWGVLTFAREPLAPRVALVVAVVPIVGWAVILSTGPSMAPGLLESLDLLPIAVSTLFELFVVGVLGLQLRRDREATTPPPRAPGTAKYLLGIGAGALVIATLTSPALAATEAGAGASMHGSDGGEPLPEVPEHDTEPEH
jgi:hypothetical protein